MKRFFSIELMLAWRNVWKNKRRTVLTLLTIMVGCGMIIFMNALAKGGHDQMIEDAVSNNAGHVQIHEKGYWDNRSIEYAFQPSDELMKKLEFHDEIKAFTERVEAGALLSYEDTTTGGMIQAVDPETEPEVTNLHTKILDGGRYLTSSDETSVVIGSTLAKNLEVGVGDTFAMISQGFDGSIAAENITVVGLFESGNPEYDRQLVLMPLSRAKETFTMMGYINSIVIRTTETDKLMAVRDDIRKIVESDRIEVMAWDELMPELVQFIVMDDVGAYVFDLILFMVVAFGILNTIQMSVYERTREFGVMLAIGTRPGQVTLMILFETMFIAFFGVLLGIAIGGGLSWYFKVNPMDWSAYAEEMSVWGVSIKTFPADMTALNVSLTVLITFALSLIFSVFPARRAAKLNPIDAIRHL